MGDIYFISQSALSLLIIYLCWLDRRRIVRAALDSIEKAYVAGKDRGERERVELNTMLHDTIDRQESDVRSLAELWKKIKGKMIVDPALLDVKSAVWMVRIKHIDGAITYGTLSPVTLDAALAQAGEMVRMNVVIGSDVKVVPIPPEAITFTQEN